jgi:FKBP-type peptidyl-prolyl cis-trans isomerase
MKLNYKIIVLVPLLLFFFGCPKDDNPAIEVRPYAEVYAEDLAEIESFMQTHKMTFDADYNVTFSEITSTNPGTPIKDRTDLQFKTISRNDINYKLYYIKLRNGVDENPTKLDSVYASYKGFRTDLSIFDAAQNPIWFRLDEVIQGWQEIFPDFKTSSPNNTVNPDGTISFNDYGAGVVFIPSGLAYYNNPAGTIGAYTPIIFSFKLMKLRYRDHDKDKILSKDEYGAPFSLSAIDSDGDGQVDYRDFDDDNDGRLTKTELQNSTATLLNGYYVYSSIPTCTNGNGKKKHLDSSCN